MTIKDLIKIYETKKEKYGAQAYRHISNVLKEAKEQHKKDFSGNDHEQSWRAFKGKNLEKLIVYIIEELALVKRNLLIDYGEFGYHLPDVDIIIYKPGTGEIVAVLSSKVTLRERIAQTGYWKMKLQAQELTKHIKVYFVTPDEDGTLTTKDPAKKGRAIVEVDTDGSYVLSETDIEESDKVKMFDKFIDDLRTLLNYGR